jgi:hypothetical protein
MGQYASVAQRVADCSNLDSSLSACRLAALDASTAGISKAASITSIESQDSHRTTRDCETSGSSEELEVFIYVQLPKSKIPLVLHRKDIVAMKCCCTTKLKAVLHRSWSCAVLCRPNKLNGKML